jgi:hypothetical protein
VGKGLFKIPHSIKVDADGNVWTTDAGDGLVIKFTTRREEASGDRARRRAVGKDCGFPSAAVNNFIDAVRDDRLLFLPAGRLFLTDGYGKMRVLEYTKAGDTGPRLGRPGRRAGTVPSPAWSRL